jgi:hypothetical protein
VDARSLLPPIEVEFPDIERWQAGNTGIPYAWTFASERQGPHVTIQALTHGNEVCGAICNDWLLREALRPTRGTLTLTFANVAAYRTFSATDPYTSRCVDEDFNRLWTADILDGTRHTADLARARELRPVYDATEYLLDLHSMTDPCPPLALAGQQQKGLELAFAIGMPEHVIIDGGHKAGRRLRDYAAFDDPASPRNALRPALGAGGAPRRAAGGAAVPAPLRHGRRRVSRCAPGHPAACAAAGDRDHARRDHRHGRIRVRPTGRGARCHR